MLTMKSKYFRWVFLALIGVLFLAANRSEPVTIGATMESSDGRYYFAGGTSVAALFFSLLAIVCYLLLLWSKPGEPGDPLRGVLSRFFALWLDFLISIAIFAPIVGLIPTISEWKRTGAFVWNFERTEWASGDGFIVLASTILAVIALFIYFALPLVLQRPTPGSCIVGYQVIADDRQQITLGDALKRTAFGFIAACSFWRAFNGERKPEQGKFWLDKKFATRAVKLT